MALRCDVVSNSVHSPSVGTCQPLGHRPLPLSHRVPIVQPAVRRQRALASHSLLTESTAGSRRSILLHEALSVDPPVIPAEPSAVSPVVRRFSANQHWSPMVHDFVIIAVHTGNVRVTAPEQRQATAIVRVGRGIVLGIGRVGAAVDDRCGAAAIVRCWPRHRTRCRPGRYSRLSPRHP